MDRKEAKSVFGQQPGKYHGFASDYTNGGTYHVEDEPGMFVKDLVKYTKDKIKQSKFRLKGKPDEDPEMTSKFFVDF